MFPFSLQGTQFLVFYAAFAAVVLGLYAFYLASLGNAATSSLTKLTSDPYRIAYVRAGCEEMVRVAIVNLVDRGLLKASGSEVHTGAADALQLVHRPLDRAILELCTQPRSTEEIKEHWKIEGLCREYLLELRSAGLVLQDDEERARAIAIVVVALILGGPAIVRLFQAMARGQPVLVLIVLGVGAGWLVGRLARSHATPSGRRALSSLKTLAERTRRQLHRLQRGGATNEALLLAAIFGIYALPSTTFGWIRRLFPKDRRRKQDRDGGSCGSGGGIDSSCGGGGGGGCGGCGG